jgi:ribonuclease PH
MALAKRRPNGRRSDQIRDLKITYNIIEHAAGSVLIELGKTKVLCAATLQQGVPPFLRGKNTGWLTAEYAMLPTSTVSRTPRESTAAQRNGRCVEISRFIGRVLRTVANLHYLNEYTITLDCDVLQADGGTRTASITGAFLALERAQQVWLAEGIITQPIVFDPVVALSVGVMGQEVIVDPDFTEDSHLDADFNIVLTQSGNLIEIQGGAEKRAISWTLFDRVRTMAEQGAVQLFSVSAECKQKKEQNLPKNDLFNLQNRLASLSS